MRPRRTIVDNLVLLAVRIFVSAHWMSKNVMINLIPSQHDPNCQRCPLFEGRRHIVPSYLPSNSRILFVAQAPGKVEDQYGTVPLIGPAGKCWESALREIGVDRSVVAVANVCRCWPPEDREPKKIEITACVGYLMSEIELLKPDLIVPMGNIALEIFGYVGISKWRGHLLEWTARPGIHLYPTYHPSYIERNSHRSDIHKQFVDDLRQAIGFFDGSTMKEKSSDVSYAVVDTIEAFAEMMQYLGGTPIIAVDTETRSRDFKKTESLLCMSLSAKENTGLVIPFYRHREKQYPSNDLEPVFTTGDLDTIIWPSLRLLLENPATTKVFHNYAYDEAFLRTHGITFGYPSSVEDTMFMHYVLDPEALHDLKSLAFLYTNMGEYDQDLDDVRSQLTKTLKKNKSEVTFDYVPDEILWPYSAADADATIQMYHVLKPRILNEGLYDVYRNYPMPTRWVLNDVEREGVSIDVPYLDDLILKYEQMVASKFQAIQEHPEIVRFCKTKRDAFMNKKQKQYLTLQTNMMENERAELDPLPVFNPNSYIQLSELILKQLQLPVVKQNKRTKNPSFDEDAIKIYARKHPFMALLSEYRSLSALNSTFVVGLRSHVSNDSRVHTNYLVHGTTTGRLSSRDPNLQNIPREAKDIKDAFVADEGCWWVGFDYKQAEFRALANFSKDPQMIRDINAGHDIHKLIAALNIGIKIPSGDIDSVTFQDLTKNVTKDQRQIAKNVVFGVMYGRGAESVATQLGITVTEAQHILQVFFERYLQARFWIDQNIKSVRVLGYSITLFGRRRYYPDINSSNASERAASEREATNAPIQGTVTDITNAIGAVRIKKKMTDDLQHQLHPQTRQILTIHDALYYNIHPDDLKIMVPMIIHEMTAPITGFDVRLEVDVSIGESWGSTVELTQRELDVFFPA